MRKKRKTIELPAEWRARSEETQRLIRERLEFHRRRKEQQQAERREPSEPSGP